MKLKLRQIDFWTGITSLCGFIILVILILVMGKTQNWFEKKYTYYTLLDSAQNVSIGMPITYKGFSIGKITHIQLTKQNHVKINFVIYENYLSLMTQNSILELSITPFGLGTNFNFYSGKSPILLKQNAFIPEKKSEFAQKIIQLNLVSLYPSTDVLNQILKSTESLLVKANELLTTLDLTLQASPSVPLGNILFQLEKNFTATDSENFLKALTYFTYNLKTISDVLETKSPELINNFSQDLLEIQKIALSLQEMLPLLETALLNTNEILRNLKSNPLLKNANPAKNETTLPLIPMREEDF